ncbi:MAG: beta-lactamase family protein, partial [Gemmatimonadetes bacterium]|nr:beta-lactamase family protein [Gemmatimonadota bacterium]
MPRLTALLVLVAACGAEQPAPNAEFKRFMAEVVAAHDFAGAVVVMRGDAVVYEGAWGLANREEGVAFTPDTPIDGGSLAKTFTAAGIWQLHAEGRLSVDAPVATYVPEFPHRQTTVRHLLSHSAGLPDLDDPTGLTNLDIVVALDSMPRFEPGSRFSYCNECYDALALVTERVIGQHWSEWLAERFFAPNGLDAAFLRPARLADWSGTRTRSYRATPDSV